MLKLRSSFISAHTAGANSFIHLCRRTVSESDWDLQTFKMITFPFSLFIFLSASLWLSPLLPGLSSPPLYCNLYLCLFSSHFSSSCIVPFSLLSPIIFLFPLCLSFSSTPTLWPETDCAVRRRQQSRWSANLLSFLWSFALCMCVRVCVRHGSRYKTGESFAFLPHLATQKPCERSGRWLARCLLQKDSKRDLDVIASSDNMATEVEQGWEDGCLTCSIK